MLKRKAKRALLLVGAGLSAPAKYPLTCEIDQILFEGEGCSVKDSTGWNATPSFHDFVWQKDGPPNNPEQQKIIDRISSALRLISQETNGREGPLNYEDLYEILGHVCRYYPRSASEGWESLIGPLKTTVAELSADGSSTKPIMTSLAGFEPAVIASAYIRDIVIDILSHHDMGRSNHGHLAFLKKLLEYDPKLDLDIFSTNNDTLIETYLGDNDIAYTDGFEEWELEIKGVSSIQKLYRWNDAVFQEQRRITLQKLHGSLNWFYFFTPKELETSSYLRERVLVKSESGLVHGLRVHEKSSDETYQFENDQPVTLLGTDQKYFAYIRRPFLKLWGRLSEALDKTDKVIIIGSSLNDRGLCDVLKDWRDTNVGGRLMYVGGDKSAAESLSYNEIVPFDTVQSLEADRIIEFIDG